jgi:S-adenosylmethionine decarboxylase
MTHAASGLIAVGSRHRERAASGFRLVHGPHAVEPLAPPAVTAPLRRAPPGGRLADWRADGLNALGTHLLLELRDCNSESLKDLEYVKSAMVAAARDANATIVDISFHEFNPYGISGMVIIAESHLSIHTWPEYGYAAVDIFTCGDLIKPEAAAHSLIRAFESQSPSLVEMKRGIISARNEKLPHKPAAAGVPRYGESLEVVL